MDLPDSWHVLRPETQRDYFARLDAFLAAERAAHDVYPEAKNVFAALEATPYDDVKVLLLGQDPYHGAGQAHGLCFSVQPGVKLPPSLRNIYRELVADVGCTPPDHGCLLTWAQQGILMLNTVLTVRAGEANSHRNQGWETFTDAVIRAVNRKPTPVVFVFWGNPAQKKRTLVQAEHHVIIESPHPSPLSARRGFFGSRPFSKINEALRAFGDSEIEWQLPQVPTSLT